MTTSENTTSETPSETKHFPGTATRKEQVLSVLFLALLGALALLLLERIFGGAWRSLWSFVSTVLLLWIGLLPMVFVGSGDDAQGSRTLCVAAAFGAVLGLLYGIVFRSLIPGVFFGACVGHFVGLVLHQAGFHVQSAKSASGLRAGGAVAAAILAFHMLGMLRPTTLSNAGAGAATATIAELSGRMRRGFCESEEAFLSRMFDRTVRAVLEHTYGHKCQPGEWTVVSPSSEKRLSKEYRSVVTLEDGRKLTICLHRQDSSRFSYYQFVWAAFEGEGPSDSAVGFWNRDGSPLSAEDYLAGQQVVKPSYEPKGKLETAKAQAERLPSTTVAERQGDSGADQAVQGLIDQGNHTGAAAQNIRTVVDALRKSNQELNSRMYEPGRGGAGADQAVQNLIRQGNHTRQAESNIRNVMEAARKTNGQR